MRPQRSSSQASPRLTWPKFPNPAPVDEKEDVWPRPTSAEGVSAGK